MSTNLAVRRRSRCARSARHPRGAGATPTGTKPSCACTRSRSTAVRFVARACRGRDGGPAGISPEWSSAPRLTASGPSVGTRVVGFLPDGCLAQRVAVPRERARRGCPYKVTFSQAATFPVAGLTALLALGKARADPRTAGARDGCHGRGRRLRGAAARLARRHVNGERAPGDQVPRCASCATTIVGGRRRDPPGRRSRPHRPTSWAPSWRTCGDLIGPAHARRHVSAGQPASCTAKVRRPRPWHHVTSTRRPRDLPALAERQQRREPRHREGAACENVTLSGSSASAFLGTATR